MWLLASLASSVLRLLADGARFDKRVRVLAAQGRASGDLPVYTNPMIARKQLKHYHGTDDGEAMSKATPTAVMRGSPVKSPASLGAGGSGSGAARLSPSLSVQLVQARRQQVARLGSGGYTVSPRRSDGTSPRSASPPLTRAVHSDLDVHIVQFDAGVGHRGGGAYVVDADSGFAVPALDVATGTGPVIRVTNPLQEKALLRRLARSPSPRRGADGQPHGLSTPAGSAARAGGAWSGGAGHSGGQATGTPSSRSSRSSPQRPGPVSPQRWVEDVPVTPVAVRRSSRRGGRSEQDVGVADTGPVAAAGGVGMSELIHTLGVYAPGRRGVTPSPRRAASARVGSKQYQIRAVVSPKRSPWPQ